MRHRKYTQEFKDSAVQLVLDTEKSIISVATELGINDSTLHGWIAKHKKESNIRLPNKPISKSSSLKESEQEELVRLRKEVRILRQEKEILKKAAAYFAKETV